VPFEEFKSRNYNFVDFTRKAVEGYIPALMTQLPGKGEKVSGPDGLTDCYRHRFGSASVMFSAWIDKKAPHPILLLEQVQPSNNLKSIFKLVSRKVE
jgi:hypothetical protein